MPDHIASHDKDDITKLQDRAIADALEGLATAGAVLVEAPTGGGKTRISSRVIEKFAQAFEKGMGRNPHVLVLQHRDNLATQSKRAYTEWNPDTKLTSSYSAGGTVDQSGDITYAVIDTIAANLDKVRVPDLVVVDEAHHASDLEASRFATTLDYLHARNPNLNIMATTATPGRPDGEDLHHLIRHAPHTTIGYLELERAGQILIPETRVARVPMKDGTMLSSFVAGHSAKLKEGLEGIGALIEKNRPDTFIDDAIRQWELHFADRHAREHPGVPLPGTLVFESSTEHAEAFARRAAESGIAVAVIDSKHSDGHNERALAAYERGDLAMVISCKKLDEGIDVPRTRCVMINRRSTSEVEYHQMAGRAMRRGRDPDLANVQPLLIDCGASTAMHGTLKNRAKAIDYIQDLLNGRDMPPIMQSKALQADPAKEFSAWRLMADPPPVYGLTNGKNTIFAEKQEKSATNDLQGPVFKVVAEQKQGRGVRSVGIAVDDSGKRMTQVTEDQLREFERGFLGRERQRFVTAEARGESERIMSESLDLTLSFLAKIRGIER